MFPGHFSDDSEGYSKSLEMLLGILLACLVLNRVSIGATHEIIERMCIIWSFYLSWLPNLLPYHLPFVGLIFFDGIA